MEEDKDVLVGFEEALSWLPAHILREACGDINQQQDQHEPRARHFHHLYHANVSQSVEQLKSGRKNQSRGRYYGNSMSRTTGGPGMQAVFLEPGTKPSGTGVFLPRSAGTHLRPTKKPACSPVLLPYRVVQALNINLHSMGLHVPLEDRKTNQRCKVDLSAYNKNDPDFRDTFDDITPNENYSSEILLPKEWSY